MNQDTNVNDSLMDVLKLIADKRMEKTLDSVFSNDKEYRKMEDAVIAMEQLYDSFELDSEVREVIDKLLAERDGMNMEKVSLAYWAGMMDVITILRNLDIISI